MRQRVCSLPPESGSALDHSWIVTGIRDELLRIVAVASEQWRLSGLMLVS